MRSVEHILGSLHKFVVFGFATCGGCASKTPISANKANAKQAAVLKL